MKKYLIAIAALLLITTTILGASAFTSADVSRSTDINVEADNNAVISISPGTVGDTASLNSNGQLQIQASPNADGVNSGAQFTYGSKSSPSSKYLFSITNADSQSRSFNVGYGNIQNAQGASNPVTFTVYDSSANQISTVTPTSDGSFTVSSGQTRYVVMELDTSGLNSAADLSGDLSISA